MKKSGLTQLAKRNLAALRVRRGKRGGDDTPAQIRQDLMGLELEMERLAEKIPVPIQKPLEAQIDQRVPVQFREELHHAFYVDIDLSVGFPRPREGLIGAVFFPICRYTTEEQMLVLYKRRKLKPLCPHALSAHNKANSAFAAKYSNFTLWNSGGEMCFVVFGKNMEALRVKVARNPTCFRAGLWAAGVPISK